MVFVGLLWYKRVEEALQKTNTVSQGRDIDPQNLSMCGSGTVNTCERGCDVRKWRVVARSIDEQESLEARCEDKIRNALEHPLDKSDVL